MDDIRIKVKKFKRSKDCENKNFLEWPKEEQERLFKKVGDDFTLEMKARWKEIEIAKRKEANVVRDE